jgi:hypothetical protein
MVGLKKIDKTFNSEKQEKSKKKQVCNLRKTFSRKRTLLFHSGTVTTVEMQRTQLN